MPKISCHSAGALMCSGPSLQDGSSIPVAVVLPMALRGMLGVFDSPSSMPALWEHRD